MRRIADVLLALYSDRATSVAALVGEPAFRALRIAEINSIGRMHPFLGKHPHLTYVEYPEEDLMSLSFVDQSFDLVLTSETMEHVPNPMRAFREVRRVLRNGGRHVFTIPVDARRMHTRSRRGLRPQHHGRGGGPYSIVAPRADMLAYTDFGTDVPDILRRAGFATKRYFDDVDIVYASEAIAEESAAGALALGAAVEAV